MCNPIDRPQACVLSVCFLVWTICLFIKILTFCNRVQGTAALPHHALFCCSSEIPAHSRSLQCHWLSMQHSCLGLNTSKIEMCDIYPIAL